MTQVKWFNRRFDFNSEQNTFPSIIERLRGTPVRLEEKFKTIPPHILSVKLDETWSIKQNAGHLIDLEPLWQGRLDDLMTGKTELRPADLDNTKTNLAYHDEVDVETLLSRFRQIREKTVTLIEKLNDDQIFQSALHPRLKTPMRTMDLFLFVAEHDDHHLARITELTKLLSE